MLPSSLSRSASQQTSTSWLPELCKLHSHTYLFVNCSGAGPHTRFLIMTSKNAFSSDGRWATYWSMIFLFVNHSILSIFSVSVHIFYNSFIRHQFSVWHIEPHSRHFCSSSGEGMNSFTIGIWTATLTDIWIVCFLRFTRILFNPHIHIIWCHYIH